MTKNKIIKYALIHAVCAMAYISLVALIMSNGDKLFGKEDTLLTVVAFLLVFVISAAVMGLLIFGKPILMYLNDFKKEAVSLLFYTIGFLILIAVIVFSILIITR